MAPALPLKTSRHDQIVYINDAGTPCLLSIFVYGMRTE